MDEAPEGLSQSLTSLLAPLMLIALLSLAVLAGLLWYVLAAVSGAWHLLAGKQSWR